MIQIFKVSFLTGPGRASLSGLQRVFILLSFWTPVRRELLSDSAVWKEVGQSSKRTCSLAGPGILKPQFFKHKAAPLTSR